MLIGKFLHPSEPMGSGTRSIGLGRLLSHAPFLHKGTFVDSNEAVLIENAIYYNSCIFVSTFFLYAITMAYGKI